MDCRQSLCRPDYVDMVIRHVTEDGTETEVELPPMPLKTWHDIVGALQRGAKTDDDTDEVMVEIRGYEEIAAAHNLYKRR